ncbi:phage portal protein [Nocardioides sp. BP30]|uniref:phage portal protein n=1 Tax=Nocardioides sp. BP30 TaxID=3036374 RepID=UPI002468F726|nr:phage portal protein [Nocardioides sp. BP30]WGL50647.1 phage portal protein [Nocardioides sp. BP30]
MKLWEQLLARPSAADQARGLSLDELIGAFTDPQTGLLNTSWGNLSDEELVTSVEQAYRENGPVFALIVARMQIFSQARFQWTRSTDGSPSDLFGTPDLQVLEFPWHGARTSALLNRMELDASTAGNFFGRRLRRGNRQRGTFEDRMVRLRPQWTTILLGSLEDAENPWEAADVEVAGYLYKPNGDAGQTVVLGRDEVAHYAPLPDPVANFRGMSWITPSMTTVKADSASEVHRFKFFENAATPNLAIKFDPSVTVDQVKQFKQMLEDEHRGRFNAYKTMFLGGGADPIAIGKDFQQMAFVDVQAKGETRLAADAGVPPSWVGFSEGLQGSALNAGNFAAARRRFGDGTLQHLWECAATALEVVLERPASQGNQAPARLTHDPRSIPFLREDMKDLAAARQQDATTMQSLIHAGFEPDSVVAAMTTSDWSKLKHSGLVSVQLQKPGENPTGQTTNQPTEQGGSDA